ncbi:hypothetical protein M0802_009445 [Mischocyttarus mexicanus]|nr:hypothetical protein M0802_009445 [Mischocyttarus mexicanus]
MSDVEKQIKEYFNVLIPKLANHLRNDFDKFEYEFNEPKDSFFSSGIYFLKIQFWIKNDNNDSDNIEQKTTIMRFVIKTSLVNEALQKMLQIKNYFHNEVTFYRNFVTENDNYPKCVYIDDQTDSFGSTLILEDASHYGYLQHPKKIDIPMDDIIVAMKGIARFHGKGYVMKEKQPDKFTKLINDIKECRYTNELGDDHNHPYVYLINRTIQRPVVYLKEHNYDKNFCDKIEEHFKNAYYKIVLKLIKPIEPLAVFCHGDYTINNMLFKRTQTESKLLLLDFALIRYGSPSIDLSTFICLSCINQVTCNNLSMVLRAYHDELIKYLQENNIKDLDKYSYDAFYNDYIDNAVFGLAISSFYLYLLVDKTIKLPSLLTKTIQEIAELAFVTGGDKVSKMLADLLLDLKELGCFNHVLS